IKSAQSGQRLGRHLSASDISITPATMTASAAACCSVSCSCKKISAPSTAKIGAVLEIALDMVGPIRRLASKFRNETSAGKKIPTAAKTATAEILKFSKSSRNGESSQRKSVVVGMLTSVPASGGISCSAGL